LQLLIGYDGVIKLPAMHFLFKEFWQVEKANSDDLKRDISFMFGFHYF